MADEQELPDERPETPPPPPVKKAPPAKAAKKVPAKKAPAKKAAPAKAPAAKKAPAPAKKAPAKKVTPPPPVPPAPPAAVAPASTNGAGPVNDGAKQAAAAAKATVDSAPDAITAAPLVPEVHETRSPVGLLVALALALAAFLVVRRLRNSDDDES